MDRKGGQYIDTKDFAARVSQELKAVKKDNDFIYHDVVPTVDKLTKPGTAQIAKPIELSTPFSTESVGKIWDLKYTRVYSQLLFF